jgi:hypothetical protein
MAAQQGQYNLQDALNRALRVFARCQFGTMLQQIINAVNAGSVQNDIGLAIDAGLLTAFGSGTLTIAGTVAAGNTFNVAVVNTVPALTPLLAAPGVTIGPIAVIAGDTVTTIATRLAAALNANQVLTNYTTLATSAAGVVTLKTPGVPGNTFTLTPTLSPGAVLTVTAVNPSGGTGTWIARSAVNFAMPNLNSFP